MTAAVRVVRPEPGRDIRCPNDNRKLGVTIIPGGRHQVRCPRCGSIVQFETWPDGYIPPAPPVTVGRIR